MPSFAHINTDLQIFARVWDIMATTTEGTRSPDLSYSGSSTLASISSCGVCIYLT